MDTKEYILRRSGKKDRILHGTLLTQVATHRDDDESKHRGYEITLYETPDGQHWVQWIYTRTYSGPVTRADYQEVATLADALAAVEAFKPQKWVPHSGNVLDFFGARMQIAVQYEYDELLSALYRELGLRDER